MIASILNSAGSNFSAVRYNDKKIESEKGELLSIHNFGSWITKESSQEDFRNYFQSLLEDSGSNTKKPQFHATISTRGIEHSKEQLDDVAQKFMKEMGYANQPYMVIFHNDTNNNHVHIVSTRIDAETKKLKRDSFERVQAAIAMKKILGQDYKNAIEKILNTYKYSNINQLKLILERSGFQTDEREEFLKILKNGVTELDVPKENLNFTKASKTDLSRSDRLKEIKAIANKYKNIHNTKIFTVKDNRANLGAGKKDLASLPTNSKTKFEIESEFQHKMRIQFGLDFVLHNSDGKQPYGYTIIDHKTGEVFKGGEIMPLEELFEWTGQEIDKATFEHLRKLNTNTDEKKELVLDYFSSKGVDIKDYMIFNNRDSKNEKILKWAKRDVENYLRGWKNSNMNVIQKGKDGEDYVLNLKHNIVYKLSEFVDVEAINKMIENDIVHLQKDLLDEIINELSHSDDSAEKQRNSRKKGYIDDGISR